MKVFTVVVVTFARTVIIVMPLFRPRKFLLFLRLSIYEGLRPLKTDTNIIIADKLCVVVVKVKFVSHHVERKMHFLDLFMEFMLHVVCHNNVQSTKLNRRRRSHGYVHTDTKINLTFLLNGQKQFSN